MCPITIAQGSQSQGDCQEMASPKVGLLFCEHRPSLALAMKYLTSHLPLSCEIDHLHPLAHMAIVVEEHLVMPQN